MDTRLWLELLTRSGALLLAGAALLRRGRTSSAAFRHRLLFSLFLLLAFLPVMTAVFPEIPFTPWTTPHDADAVVSIESGPSRAIGQPVHPGIHWMLLIWLGGFAAACSPLLAGSLSARRLRHRAQVAPLPASIQLPPGVELRLSNELPIPITCGLLRPWILLPRAAEAWSPTRLEAVLLHEMAHVRRHDLAVQFAVHLISALWWFQPLVWVLRRQLRNESELACDAAVIGSGFRASQYAEELLGVARSVGGAWKLSGSAIGMVRPSGLEQRLRAVLNPQVSLLSRGRVCAIGAALAAASIAASAFSVGSYQSSEEQGGSLMKRTITSALLTSAGLSAATMGGYIHDSQGTAVADAKISLYSPDTSAKQETTTGSDGKFGVSLGEGQYILRVEKRGFASIFRVFDLRPDSKVDRDFTMAREGDKAVADSSVIPVEPQTRHIRVGGQVAQSNLVMKITPLYPLPAKQAGIQGMVDLAVTISKEGVPLDLRVVSSPSDDLSESAVEAVRQWRYRPTLLNGQPVEIETSVVVNYTLVK